MSKAVVGVRWGRARGNWWRKKRERKFLPVGNNGKRDKTGKTMA